MNDLVWVRVEQESVLHRKYHASKGKKGKKGTTQHTGLTVTLSNSGEDLTASVEQMRPH